MTNYLLTVACTLFMFGAGQVCVPCEENTRCKIAYAFQYTGSGLDQLIWSNGGKDAAVCDTRNGNMCELYQDFKEVVFSKIERQSDFMTTNIQFTADRNNQLLTAKKWELVYSSTVVYTCDVHYYKKIYQAMCHHKISKKGLHIECTSANVYPKSCCNFSVKVNRASWDLQLTPEYNHTVVKTDPVYFDTVCALDIAPADLESGVWEVNVTMYPDIFNDDGKNCKPTNGGKTFLFNITIEHPVISLYNCPNAVEDGKEFNCICQRDDKSDVHTVVYWKKQGANRSNNNISAVLIATAKKKETGFTCIAENVIGWKTIFNYNISIFDKVKTANCSHFASTQGLRFKCVVSNVYPESVCAFNFNFEKLQIQDAFDVIYNHTPTSHIPLTYTTECYLDIPIAALIPRRLYYTVSISPDIDVVDEVQKAGVIIQANTSLELPGLFLYDCPDTIQENEYVHCVCALKGHSDIKTLVFWSTSSIVSDIKTERTAILSTVKKDTDYNCIARNEFGWTTAIQYNPKIKEQTHTDVKIVIIPYVSVAILVILLCLNVFLVFDLRKQTEQVKLLAHFSHPKNYTKRIHNQGQKNIKDVAATCNKQPEEIDVCEESLID